MNRYSRIAGLQGDDVIVLVNTGNLRVRNRDSHSACICAFRDSRVGNGYEGTLCRGNDILSLESLQRFNHIHDCTSRQALVLARDADFSRSGIVCRKQSVLVNGRNIVR